FPAVKVRDGKTGEDFFNELATDKRFLPYLDEPGPAWTGAKVKPKEEYGTFQPPNNKQVFTFEPAGEVLPFFQRNKVALELNFHQLKVLDRVTNEERWSQNLTRTNFMNFLYNFGNPNQPPRFQYHAVGHLFVLSLGHMVFGLDPVNKKVLWER